MKVIVDNKIPYIKEAVGQIADEVVYLPGAAFTPRDVKDVDALIIRTRTCCNRELLEGSSVKFIATATIGFDHIDVDYCREAGIAWSNCPGCNTYRREREDHTRLCAFVNVNPQSSESVSRMQCRRSGAICARCTSAAQAPARNETGRYVYGHCGSRPCR